MYVVQKNVSDKSHLHEFQMRRCRRLMDDGGQLGDMLTCAYYTLTQHPQQSPPVSTLEGIRIVTYLRQQAKIHTLDNTILISICSVNHIELGGILV